MKIEKGKHYECVKTMTNEFDSNTLYTKGNIYLSEKDNCITDDKGSKFDEWDKNAISEYIKPVMCKQNIIFSDFPTKVEKDPINPEHYKSYSVETIDMMIAIYGKEKVAIHCELTAFKYRMRMGKKKSEAVEQVDGHFINCYKKEQWYLNKAKELRNDNPMTNL